MNNKHPSIGIDIGGTRIKAVVVGNTGEVLNQTIEPTVDEINQLAATVNRLVKHFDLPNANVGICTPGLVSSGNRSVSWMRGRLEAVEGLVWQDHLERETWVLNDAHAAILAEAWGGAIPNAQHAIMLTLGTGVGGAIIMDGRLVQGAIGRAGHLGHICLNVDGPRDIVRTPGSLEDLIGNHSLSERTEGRFHKTSEMLKAAKNGDRFAARCWEKSIQALAAGIASLINVLDPEVVVLGGGIAKCGEQLFDPLQVAMGEVEWCPAGKAVPIVPASLGEMAGAIGAARFATLQTSGEHL